MEVDPTRVCELLVGLSDVTVLRVVDGRPLEVHVETRSPRPSCGSCGTRARVKDRPVVELVDLPAFGRPCGCGGASTAGAAQPTPAQSDPEPVKTPPRGTPPGETDRAGRWVTEQVGRYGRTVNDVAVEWAVTAIL